MKSIKKENWLIFKRKIHVFGRISAKILAKSISSATIVSTHHIHNTDCLEVILDLESIHNAILGHLLKKPQHC